MKRRLLVLFVLILIGLIGSLLLGVLSSPHYSGRVYTVTEVQAGLRRDPQRWVGQTVRVYGRAMVTLCPDHCPYSPQFLIDASAPSLPSTLCPPPQGIPFRWTVIDPRIDFLLRLPMLSDLVRTHLGGVGTYRVRIQRNSAICNGIPEKYQAVLLDALT